MPEKTTVTARQALNWIVFKVVQHCNLNCTYCYVYNRGDDSWKSRPRTVSSLVVERLGARIFEHCAKYGLTEFNVELHGGEPLLLGKERMRSLLNTLKTACSSCKIIFHLQTNGLLLDEEWLELFHEENVFFGISIDGPPDLGDRFRLYHDGSGSTRDLEEVLRRINKHPSFISQFGGVLCVIADPTYPPERILAWLGELGVKRVDFLLPDGNYENLPQDWKGAGAYSDFLLNAWSSWMELGNLSPKIRMFEHMLAGLLGETPTLDSLGGDLEGLCVVESDGSIGVSDVARICKPLSNDIITIFTHSLDARPEIYDLSNLQILSDACTSCKYLKACNGGYLPHRFDGRSFNNPSLYCAALYNIADRIYHSVTDAVPSAAVC